MLAHSGNGKSGQADGDPSSPDTFYTAMRFMLDERRGDYTKFVEVLFGDLDLALQHIINCNSIDELIEASKGALEVEESLDDFKAATDPNDQDRSPRFVSTGLHGGWAIANSNRVIISRSMYDHLNQLQQQLCAKLSMTKKS